MNKEKKKALNFDNPIFAQIHFNGLEFNIEVLLT